MEQQNKTKELLVDIYGLTVFVTSLLLIVIALGLCLMSMIYLTDGELIRPAMTTAVGGVMLFYSINLIRQIQ